MESMTAEIFVDLKTTKYQTAIVVQVSLSNNSMTQNVYHLFFSRTISEICHSLSSTLLKMQETFTYNASKAAKISMVMKKFSIVAYLLMKLMDPIHMQRFLHFCKVLLKIWEILGMQFFSPASWL
jgi:hypothetical protein